MPTNLQRLQMPRDADHGSSSALQPPATVAAAAAAVTPPGRSAPSPRLAPGAAHRENPLCLMDLHDKVLVHVFGFLPLEQR